MRRVLGALVVLVACGGCASTEHDVQLVQIKTNAPIVRVRENGKFLPVDGQNRVTLQRRVPHELELSAPGFKPSAPVKLTPQSSGGRLALCILSWILCPPIGLPILMPIHIGSEAWIVFEPEEIAVDLVKDGAGNDRPGSAAAHEADPVVRGGPGTVVEREPGRIIVREPAPTTPGARFCGACGARLGETMKFCSDCGARR